MSRVITLKINESFDQLRSKLIYIDLINIEFNSSKMNFISRISNTELRLIVKGLKGLSSHQASCDMVPCVQKWSDIRYKIGFLHRESWSGTDAKIGCVDTALFDGSKLEQDTTKLFLSCRAKVAEFQACNSASLAKLPDHKEKREREGWN